jgi:3-hydroxybutyryl-CoA dehydratase
MNTLTFRITEEDVEQYADVSFDYNPIHLDLEEAKQRGFTNKIAHGMLTVAKVLSILSNELLEPQVMLHKYEFTFLSPVYVGDQVTLIFTQTEQAIRIEGKCDKKLVIRGHVLLQE